MCGCVFLYQYLHSNELLFKKQSVAQLEYQSSRIFFEEPEGGTENQTTRCRRESRNYFVGVVAIGSAQVGIPTRLRSSTQETAKS